MFSNTSNSTSTKDLAEALEQQNQPGKKHNRQPQNRNSSGGRNNPKPTFVNLSKLNKLLINASVGINVITSTILYYNLPEPFSGSDAAQALWLGPMVVGVLVLIAMFNTSSEDTQA